jgi:hypothetical protein
MSDGMPISDQFKEAIAELEGIKTQLMEAQKAIKVLKDPRVQFEDLHRWIHEGSED